MFAPNEGFLPDLGRLPPQVERFGRVAALRGRFDVLLALAMGMLPGDVVACVLDAHIYRRRWRDNFNRIICKTAYNKCLRWAARQRQARELDCGRGDAGVPSPPPGAGRRAWCAGHSRLGTGELTGGRESVEPGVA